MRKINETFMVDMRSKGVALRGDVRKRINRELYDLVYNTYFDAIPLDDIERILNRYDVYLINEDGTPFGAIFTGASGDGHIGLAQRVFNADFVTVGNHVRINNVYLILQWYKMTATGRYEINVYVS
jgi:hypothetical protein